jgi:tripartite-type tricarboxylate transporter receptor subunit TctC
MTFTALKWSALPAVFGLAVFVALAAGSAAAADSVADFYKGKTVTIWVGYSPGGGYDVYARTFARHWGKHLPGNPEFIIKNRPGAGSLLLTNELYNILPKDGTAIGVIGRGMPQEKLLGNDQAEFESSKFTWIGSANNEVSVCVSWARTGIKSFQDLRTRGMIVGGTGEGADTDTFPKVMNNVLGTKLKLVTGYPGGADILFAMERGELEGRCGYSWSSAVTTHGDWLRDKKMNVLVQISTERHPDLPDVPFIMDLAENDQDRLILEFIFARQAWGRPFVAPPGVPADRARALQDGFMAVTQDPAFIAEVKKQKLEVNALPGPKVAQLIARMNQTPLEVVNLAREATDKKDKIQISKVKLKEITVKGSISDITKGGRAVMFEGGGQKGELAISGSRTKITIGGAKASRKQLKKGMSCEFVYTGSAAKAISCS